MPGTENNRDDSSKSLPQDEASSSEGMACRKEGILTAAELMRRRAFGGVTARAKKNTTDEHEVEDIDDEIKRLEAELAEDSLSSGSSDSDSSDEEESNHNDKEVRDDNQKKKISFGDTTILNNNDLVVSGNRASVEKGSTVICESSCAADTIAPLPPTMLPQCKSKKLKIDFEGDDMNDGPTSSSKMGRKRKRSKKNDSDVEEKGNTQKSDGLRDAVLEVLQGYVARSSERIPFYCRVCSHQSSNEEEFLAHKKTEFHKTAVQVERKKTYCKLCRKQLTSLVQMQEHLESRPHKEKLEHMRARQRGGSTFQETRRSDNMDHGRGGNNRSGRGMGRGRGGRGGRWHNHQDKTNLSKRQWC
mmetsp:Transcript_1500/g.2159  ORF Transcript_1500/g.2159 Transcript_1500/m.2159 type:complete len:359 (+) Transcript_1500:83-1159(+)